MCCYIKMLPNNFKPMWKASPLYWTFPYDPTFLYTNLKLFDFFSPAVNHGRNLPLVLDELPDRRQTMWLFRMTHFSHSSPRICPCSKHSQPSSRTWMKIIWIWMTRRMSSHLLQVTKLSPILIRRAHSPCSFPPSWFWILPCRNPFLAFLCCS